MWIFWACEYLKDQTGAFLRLPPRAVVSPSASLEAEQHHNCTTNCRDLFLSLAFVPSSPGQANELRSPCQGPFIFQSPWISVSTTYTHAALVPSSPRPLLSKIVANPISLSESICSFHDLTDLNEIFLPLPLLILRNTIKIRLKCSRIPRMKKLCEEQSCSKHSPVTPAETQTMLTENTAKQKLKVQDSSMLVCVRAQFFSLEKKEAAQSFLNGIKLDPQRNARRQIYNVGLNPC